MPDATHDQPHRPELDVSRVEADGGPVRVLSRISNAREPGFAIVVQRSVVQAVHEHGESDTSVEICGVLVGNVHHDRISPYLLIDAHIPGAKAKSKGTQVTFTAETWNDIQREMEAKHPDKKVVGWYHTHPGFGVFLSGMDLFIQDNFFNLPWQVAWVYDPVAKTDGMFVWKQGRSEKATFLIEENLGGDWGHDFRGALPDDQHPDAVAARNARRSMSAQLLLAILAIFMTCFLVTWYALIWLTENGFRVRLPIE
jgi:proteasome lid subunit RPN8/RPN11